MRKVPSVLSAGLIFQYKLHLDHFVSTRTIHDVMTNYSPILFDCFKNFNCNWNIRVTALLCSDLPVLHCNLSCTGSLLTPCNCNYISRSNTIAQTTVAEHFDASKNGQLSHFPTRVCILTIIKNRQLQYLARHFEIASVFSQNLKHKKAHFHFAPKRSLISKQSVSSVWISRLLHWPECRIFCWNCRRLVRVRAFRTDRRSLWRAMGRDSANRASLVVPAQKLSILLALKFNIQKSPVGTCCYGRDHLNVSNILKLITHGLFLQLKQPMGY